MAQKATTIFSSLAKNFGSAAGAIIVVLGIGAFVYTKTFDKQTADFDTTSGIRKQVMINTERMSKNAESIVMTNTKVDQLTAVVHDNAKHNAAVEAKLDILIEIVKSNGMMGRIAGTSFE